MFSIHTCVCVTTLTLIPTLHTASTGPSNTTHLRVGEAAAAHSRTVTVRGAQPVQRGYVATD
jgi:hypothetical protein